MRRDVAACGAASLVALALLALLVFAPPEETQPEAPRAVAPSSAGRRFRRLEDELTGVHAGPLGNATIRAEVGRSTWTLHTMAARYPDEPTDEQTADFHDWILLLSKLYPCGQCAEEFQKILRAHPPELTSKAAAVDWLCRVHNIVNARLDKPAFDCSTVRARWKCGCPSEV